MGSAQGRGHVSLAASTVTVVNVLGKPYHCKWGVAGGNPHPNVRPPRHNGGMLLDDVVTVSSQVAATRSRLAKRSAIAALLRRAEAADIEIVVTYLAGELRQRRTGVGWAGLASLPPPAPEPTLSLHAVDETFADLAQLSGPGSAAARSRAVLTLFGQATAAEQRFLRGLVSGDVRQGALDAVVLLSLIHI